ncbi:short-chain dehydrogenase/reductase [Microdochium bolleyi]|uniref:Short-chain dehydrogenase/reductase n=1 Tax=Microdochium bolleyi TaxID=196109 RepID=A0A136IYF9_9PEZI|nr:short-chain dehydrogenase/reductase [Microdochium bolleyi]
MPSPQQKTVLITGCSAGGIGASLALEFHRRGHRVFATARDMAKMSDLAAAGVTCLALDTTSASSITAAVAHVTRDLSSSSPAPGLDVLINNAGIHLIRPFMDCSIAELQRVMDTNVMGVMAVTHAFLPLLIAAKGVIATVGSTNEVMLPPFQSAYSASKAAVHAWGNTLRAELKPLGVRVVTVVTGAVRTRIFDNERERSAKTADASGGGAGERGLDLPEGSPYKPCEDIIRERRFLGKAKWQEADEYARRVADALLQPAATGTIWKGGLATVAWVMSVLGWEGMLESAMMKENGLDQIKV